MMSSGIHSSAARILNFVWARLLRRGISYLSATWYTKTLLVRADTMTRFGAFATSSRASEALFEVLTHPMMSSWSVEGVEILEDTRLVPPLAATNVFNSLLSVSQ